MDKCPICHAEIAENNGYEIVNTKENMAFNCCAKCAEHLQTVIDANDLVAVEKSFDYLYDRSQEIQDKAVAEYVQIMIERSAELIAGKKQAPPIVKSQPEHKYCSNCGQVMMIDDETCSSCGFSENTFEMHNETNDKMTTEPPRESKPVDKSRIIRIIAFVLMAISILISFEIAANLIAKGGEGISDITSVGGRTLEEAYYYELGFIYEGYALIVRTVGRVFAALLVWVGAKK